MTLPKPISVQSINGLKVNQPLAYESHKRTIDAFNQLIGALQPGATIKPENFTLPPSLGTGAKISAVSGSFKRGSVTMVIGTAPTLNPTLSLNFPSGLFSDSPFAQVVNNGSTGTLKFFYSESVQGLQITLSGTPVAGEIYKFNYMVTE